MIEKLPTPRTPQDAPPPPIGELATLPIFFKLRGRRAVLVGGSDGAAWKGELLAAAGAQVDVFCEAPGQKMQSLRGKLNLIERDWEGHDLKGAALIIGDVEDETQAQMLRDAAVAAGVPVNIVDKPAFCDFQFGTIVERSPLIIGISTDGAAPVLGQALRARLEALLPQGMRAWAQAARDWRREVRAKNLDASERRHFWREFAQAAFARPALLPSQFDREAAFDSARKANTTGTGCAILVGAGPGDPELLTLKAVQALQSADVVLYDDLVSPVVVEMARREAVRIAVGKRGYKPSCTQEDISELIVAHAKSGQRVVRLKGGDPMIFGRANEEIAVLRAAGISVEVVPGVTAAAAAAAALQTSLTERDVARRLQFITAHGRDGHLPKDLDWRSLADARATSVVYMGVKTFRELAERLMREGLPASTPAAMVERASWPDQSIVRATVGTLADEMARRTIKGPCVILMGAAIGMNQASEAEKV